MRLGWLVQQIDEDIEVYRLSAHAVEALEIAGRTGGGRTRVSNSRVRTLLEAVEHLADSAEADPLRRLARLREERAALDAEIDRIEESGRADPLDDEELYEEAENVLHLARELPADFTRVAESLKLMQRDVVAHLRRDERPTGEVLREYLQRAQDVMNSTPEGRAFAGALRLIGDPDRIDALTEQLHGLLRQPFARMLDATQRAELDAIGRRVELGVEEVLAAQRRASHVITGQVKTHDPLRDRQIDDLLRDVIAALHVWDGTGASAAPVRSLPLIDLGHLRQTVSSIRPPAVPAPLADAEDVEFPDIDTRAWGGPRYAELEEYVSNLGPGVRSRDRVRGCRRRHPPARRPRRTARDRSSQRHDRERCGLGRRGAASRRLDTTFSRSAPSRRATRRKKHMPEESLVTEAPVDDAFIAPVPMEGRHRGALRG